jgi:hypothetical protein
MGVMMTLVYFLSLLVYGVGLAIYFNQKYGFNIANLLFIAYVLATTVFLFSSLQILKVIQIGSS